jgi:Big-like domain-containing protein
MYHFNVDDAVRDSCQVCCCEQATLKPGTTSRLTINYAPWAVPIGRLHCDPEFALEQMAACGLSPGAPVKLNGVNVMFNTAMNTVLDEDLKTRIVDPEAKSMTFKVLPFHTPSHGVVAVKSDGTFKYTPQGGYNGPDRFYVSATDEDNKTSTFEVLIGVGTQDAGDMVETPHVVVDSWNVNYQHYIVTVAVRVAPNADQCEVWRLTARQTAIDCNCTCYDRTDCFDIKMSTC